jgi:hypothetical protein
LCRFIFFISFYLKTLSSIPEVSSYVLTGLKPIRFYTIAAGTLAQIAEDGKMIEPLGMVGSDLDKPHQALYLRVSLGP